LKVEANESLESTALSLLCFLLPERWRKQETPGGLTASWAGLRGPLAIAKGGGMLKGDEHQNGIVASVR
jgi:hypothetical protein